MAQALKLIAVLLVALVVGGGLYLWGSHLRHVRDRQDAAIHRLDCQADPGEVDCP